MNSLRETNQTDPVNQLDDALTLLRRLPVFKNISLEMVKLYAYLSNREQYRKGDLILLQGTPSDGMRLITKGEVAITHTMADRELLLQELSVDALNCFGELALICDFDWFFSAHARTEVSILSISRESFRKVTERYPETFIGTVEEIIKLRVKRFVNQTNYLVDHLEESALNKLTMHPLAEKTDNIT